MSSISSDLLQHVQLRKVESKLTQDSSLKDAVELEKSHNARLRAVDLESWYSDALLPFTFPTVFIPITPSQAQALIRAYHLIRTSPFFSSSSSSPPQSPLASSASQQDHTDPRTLAYLAPLAQADEQILAEIRSLADAIRGGLLELFGEEEQGKVGVFAKLSSRSPKDSKFCEERALESVKEALSALYNENEKVSGNAILTTVMSRGIQALKLHSAEEILACFLSSDRVCEDDIPLALSFPQSWSQHLVLRRWVDIPIAGEFRAFVFGGRLTAVSQYFTGCYFEQLVAERERVLAMIISFFDQVRPLIHVEPAEYVIDIAVDLSRDKVYIIELNPFGKPNGLGTGTCLFKNSDPHDLAVLFGEAPLEFRIEHTSLMDIKHLLRDAPLKIWLQSQNYIDQNF